MTNEQGRGVLAISLMASFADGARNEEERSKLKEIMGLLSLTEISAAELYRDVLTGKLTLAGAAALLGEDSMRHLAYEMAVLVCDADGAASEREKAFLRELADALPLPRECAAQTLATADRLVSEPLVSDPPPAARATPPGSAAGPDASLLEPMILRYAVVTAACELMPQSLGSLAIIPLQLKMVYRIGKHFGYELDAGHIKDLLAALGVGLTAQALDGVARKFFGRMTGKMAGGLVGKAAGAAAGSAVTFGTTWALGQIARQYYGGGRKLGMDDLKKSFQGLVEQGKTLQSKYAGQINSQAGALNLADLARGKIGI